MADSPAENLGTDATPPSVERLDEGGVPQAARDAIVLLTDAEARCVRVANGKVSILNSQLNKEDLESEQARYSRDVEDLELAVADRSLKTVEGLRPLLAATTTRTVLEAIDVMAGAVDQFRKVAERWTLPELEDALTRQTSAFQGAEMRLSRTLVISKAERREILDRYRYQARRGVSGSLASANTGSGTGRVIADEPDREQYEKEKRKWDEFVAHKESEEAERRRVEAALREEVEARRRNVSRPPLPTAGLTRETEERIEAAREYQFSPELQPQYEAWYSNVEADLTAFKTVLARAELAAGEGMPLDIQICEDLIRTCSRLLGRPEVFKTPIPALGRVLDTAWREFYEAGKACIDKDSSAEQTHLDRANAARAEAAEILRPYGFEP